MVIIRRILRWIDEETGLVTTIHNFMAEPLPKGVGWPHVFGSVVFFIFILQVLTGAFMMIYYTPTPDHAHESVEYLQSLPFGRIVRGLHHFGSSAMVIFVGVHMLQAFLWGAYKRPRQIIWVIGVFLMLITLAFSFTGYLLPWDQKAYWATVVGTNIAGSIPIIGPHICHILRGGEEVGSATLTRFFAIHVFLLPALMTVGIVFHICQLRKRGITPPWSKVGEEPEEKPLLFYPDQVFKDLVAALIVFLLLLGLAIRFGAPLEDVANPSDTAYVPRPEWYFLPLFVVLKYLPEKYGEFTGAILIPTIGVVILLLFPYVDRGPERVIWKRPFATGLAIFVLFVLTVFGVRGLTSTPMPKKLNALEAGGEKVFMDKRCSACHGINGGGGTAGPDLATMVDTNPRRLEAVLRNPTAFNPRSIMPSYNSLPDEDIKALVAYMMTLGPGSRMPRVPRVGPKKPPSHFEEEWMFNHKLEVRKDPAQCGNCHEPEYCRTCHQNRRPDSHLKGWMKAHFGTATEKPEYCQACHERSYCNDCHKAVIHTPNWIKEHPQATKLKPYICKECHNYPDFCINCHKGAQPSSHVAGWVRTHATQLTANKSLKATCSVCHEKGFCSSCHTGAKPESHTKDFIQVHGRQAKIDKATCQTCHTQEFCSNCHKLPMPHPEGFESQHANLARVNPTVCMNCHQIRQANCLQCHQSKKPKSHTADWRETHGQKVADGGISCQFCHGRNSCMNCHKTPMPHPENWILEAHGRVASFEAKSFCFNCHTKSYCNKCHQK